MTRYAAPLLLTATACAAAALSADARLIDPHTSSSSQQRNRRTADEVQGLPTGGDGEDEDEFSRLGIDDNTNDLPVPGTGDVLERAVPLDNGPATSTSAVIAEAIAEAASEQSEVDEDDITAAADLANLSNFGTTLFHKLLMPVLDGSADGGTSSSANILLSPLSIGQALALVSAGATPGSTCEAELLGVLGASRHDGVPLLTDVILSSSTGSGGVYTNNDNDGDSDSDTGVSLTTSSSIWLHSSIFASFEERAEIVHHATAQPLPRTYQPINEWAELVSDGAIQNLFDGSEVIDPLMRAALVNVVSFRGTWTHQFDADKTALGVFYKRSNAAEEEKEEEKVVQYMKDRRHVLLHPSNEELGDALVMKLDYGPVRRDPERGWDLPSEFAALFILPKDATVGSERAALEGMAQSSVTDLIQSLRPREVNLSVPKFKLEYGTASISDALRSMGVNEVFDGREVLSEMSDDPELHLSDVFHKAVMEVTEEGTTASAATAAMIMTRSIPPPPMDLEFNRPFFAMIVHVETGTPLFIGRVGDPNLSFEEDGMER